MSKENLMGVYREAKWNHLFQVRLDKQKDFFNRKEKGDLLLYVNRRGRGIPISANYFYNLLANKEIESLLKKETFEDITVNYLNQIGYSLYSFYLLGDDAIPTIDVFYHVGSIMGAMTGEKVIFSGQTNWCKHQLKWEDIYDLKFDPDIPWVQFPLGMYRALWKFWDEDFLIGGYWHKSPLDAAWDLVGQSIFEKMYTDPEEVKKLISWCCEWSISMENFLKDKVESVSGYRGVWGTFLPDGAVFINGDPIDLIKPDFAREFDLPYSSKLFTTVGGGFYHHHSLGLFQAPVVAQIEGISVQNIYNDYPNSPDMARVIIEDGKIKEQVIYASHVTPVYLDGVPYKYIDRLIPVLREGRFIVSVVCESLSDANECISKIKNINNLK